MTISSANHDPVESMIARAEGHVHMVGVCGIGMAGVACLLRRRGFSVTGCDVVMNRQGTWLEEQDISVSVPHDPSHIDSSVDWVIRSTAVSPASEEIQAAQSRGIPVSRRGEVLPALLEGLESVAVAGTHGKTTTATLIAQLLRGAGHDPWWCIGGESHVLGGVAGAGEESTIVVEADESDGTLVGYHPDIAVVTNVEFDHMEHFASESEFESCFKRFIDQTRRRVLYCADDERASRLCEQRPIARSYGFSAGADLQGELSAHAGGGELRVLLAGEELGILPLSIPGRHNALNALAAIGVCLELGVPFGALAAAVSGICLPKRRFEVVARDGGVTVVSDYAHHPSEIAALVQTAKQQHKGRLLAVFQPHRFTRTRALGPGFPPAFAGVDKLVLTPVYAASESPIAGGRTSDLYAEFRSDESVPADGSGTPGVVLATSLEQAWGYLRRELRDGDMLLTIGAGDVEKIGAWAGQMETGDRQDASSGERNLSGIVSAAPRPPVSVLLRQLSEASVVREDEPLARKTTYGVGGTADVWAEVGCAEDLAEILRWCDSQRLPFHILGAGSNVLVSDLGVRGVVARLTGDVFRSIRHEAGEVVVGAAVPLAKLLAWATHEALSGLEFLEGVPGGVGGIVRMNGGAYGHEICERLSWIRGLKRDGSECTVQASALEWGYRGCKSLESVVVTEVGLQLERGVKGEIAEARAQIAGRRKWMRGLRCSGSVFRNSGDQYAGRLVEELGLKGSRVGGAEVLPRHGNFIVADGNCTASDVLAQIQRVQAAVKDATGVELVREVRFFE
ncbi:MAG: UDP-N-acetylmuramate--L-alanine ligase [Verrucomicrobia bacterium]|nr:UDP-N-acetylmuramate--L-alanine ligase [Verrucomicrobiota bacterium]